MPDQTPEDAKQIVKQALKEWLDEQYKCGMETLGGWALRAFTASVFAAMVYLVLWANGWHK